MSYNQPVTVIILGHGVLAAEIQAVMADYSALRQTRRWLWADTNSSVAAHSVQIISETSSFTGIDTALREVTGVCLVAALEEVGEATDHSKVDEWLSAVESRLPGRVSRVRILLPRLPHPAAMPKSREGWATIALAPEDSDSPMSAISPVNRDAGATAAARVFAPTLLSLLGLWRASKSVPVLDDAGRAISTGSQSSFRLARAHHRSVDASEVEEKLLREVVDTSRNLPLTQFADGRQAVYLPNPQATGFEFSQALLRKHTASLLTPMQPEVAGSTIKQSGFAALKSFLKEYFRAVVGNPRMWGHSLTSKTTETIAGALQRGLYGDKSVVEVIVGNTSGRPASVAQLDRSAQLIQAKTQESGLRIEAAPTLSGLWEDYCQSALTLIDGADRLAEPLRGPMDNNHNPAIVRRGEQAVPDSSDAFDGFHPVLDDIAGMTKEQATILPFDVDRAQNYENELNYAASHSTDSAIMKLREDFSQWKNRVSQSFAWSTGHNLLHMLDIARGNARNAWQRLDSAQAEFAGVQRRDFEKENRRLAATLGALSLTWVLSVLVVVYLTVRYYRPDWRFFASSWPGLDWRWGLLYFFIITVVIVAIQMLIFMRARRGIIDERERLKLLEANLEVAVNNYHNSVSDVRKITAAYGQFLSWSTLLGRVIARPFGKPTINQEVVPIPRSGLPRSTQIGRAVVAPDAMITLINDVRAKVYRPSWAEKAFNEFITDVFAVIQQREGTNPVRLAELYGQAGYNSQSTLDRLVNWAVGPELETRDQMKRHWEQAILEPGVINKLDQALDTVSSFENQQPKETSKGQFFGQLKDINWQQTQFSNAAVTAAGASHNATTIDPALSVVDLKDPSSDNLTQSVTVVQFGPAVSLEYLHDPQLGTPLAEPHFDFTEPSEFSLDKEPKTGFGDFDFHSFDGLV